MPVEEVPELAYSCVGLIHPRFTRGATGADGRAARERSTIPAIVCLDLDRTLIYSAAALDLGVPDADAPRLLCVEVYRGAPLSYMTETAAELLRDLQGRHVVPTTTRTPEQLARVHLPGPPPRYAIASNGGHLIVDGVPDRGLDGAGAARLAGCAPLREVEAHLRASAGPFVLALRARRAASSPTPSSTAPRCPTAGWTRSPLVRARAAGRCRCRAARSTPCRGR